MRSKYYDVVFLGGHMGGLLSAISLLKKGIKVLVLDSSDYFWPFSKKECAGSPITYFGGFTLRNLLKSLGFHPLEINRFKALDPSLQVIMPGIRFDLYSDEKKLLGELKREFPDIWGEANNLFAKFAGFQDIYPKIFMSGLKFPPEGIIEKFKFKQFAKRLSPQTPMEESKLEDILGSTVKNRDFLLLFKGLINILSDLHTEKYSVPYVSQLLASARFEGYEFEGGVKAFHDLLIDKVKERGGIILNEGQVDEVDIQGSYVDSLKLSGCSIDKLILSYLVVNGNPRRLLNLIPSPRKNFVLKKRISRVSPKFIKYTFYLKVKSEVFPEGMRDRAVIISDRNAELFGANLLYVNKGHAEKLPSGDSVTTLSVSALLKPQSVVEGPYVEELVADAKKRIADIIPFLEENIVETKVPNIGKRDDLISDLRSSFVFETEGHPYFGITGIPYTTFLKNLFFAGQTVYPGLGFDGEVQAGLKVSRHISDVFKVKRP